MSTSGSMDDLSAIVTRLSKVKWDSFFFKLLLFLFYFFQTSLIKKRKEREAYSVVESRKPIDWGHMSEIGFCDGFLLLPPHHHHHSVSHPPPDGTGSRSWPFRMDDEGRAEYFNQQAASIRRPLVRRLDVLTAISLVLSYYSRAQHTRISCGCLGWAGDERWMGPGRPQWACNSHQRPSI